MIIVVTVIDLRTIYLSTYTYKCRYITDLLVFMYLAFLFWVNIPFGCFGWTASCSENNPTFCKNIFCIQMKLIL